jgi:hypothetical protein
VAVAVSQGRGVLPVLFASGSPVADWDTRDRENLKILDQDSVLVLEKPFLPADLENAVEMLLRKSSKPASLVQPSRYRPHQGYVGT